MQKRNIFVYSGAGVTRESLKHALHSLHHCLDKRYQIQKIEPRKVIEGEWESEAALFVIPGGSDLPYCSDLHGRGVQKIRGFVHNGGTFLGICAGSYFAGKAVEFAQGTENEVIGMRELAFFEGTVKGPLLACYDYRSNRGATIAKLNGCAVYYNGGGYFEGAWDHSEVTILASYDDEKRYPAVVQCPFGQGTAILSGPHIEFDPFLLNPSDPYLTPLIPELIQSNEKRVEFLKQLMRRLNLTTSSL